MLPSTGIVSDSLVLNPWWSCNNCSMNECLSFNLGLIVLCALDCSAFGFKEGLHRGKRKCGWIFKVRTFRKEFFLFICICILEHCKLFSIRSQDLSSSAASLYVCCWTSLLTSRSMFIYLWKRKLLTTCQSFSEHLYYYMKSAQISVTRLVPNRWASSWGEDEHCLVLSNVKKL